MDRDMAMHAAKADLPAQITLDQAIVALLTLRRRNVPGDAILDHATVLRFHYAMREEGTKEGTAEAMPEVMSEDIGFTVEVTVEDEELT